MSAEHAELVMEMTELEKMSHVERVKHAKKRRAQQLKYYQKCEKNTEKEDNKVSIFIISFYLQLLKFRYGGSLGAFSLEKLMKDFLCFPNYNAFLDWKMI